MKTKLIILVLFLLAAACHKVDDFANREIFFIKQGKHQTQQRVLRPADKTKPMTGTFLVGSTWQYAETFDTGWNKLIGISYGNIHQNSTRIGWRCSDGKIYACGYYYTNGTRIITDRIELQIMKYYHFDIFGGSIKLWGNGVDIQWIQDIETSGKAWFCYPYFGGEQKAPHEFQFNFNLIQN